MVFRFHGLMQHAEDHDLGPGFTIEDDVSSRQLRAQALRNLVPGRADPRIAPQLGEAGFDLAQIGRLLPDTPFLLGVIADIR